MSLGIDMVTVDPLLPAEVPVTASCILDETSGPAKGIRGTGGPRHPHFQ
jgi:hypothetical protein